MVGASPPVYKTLQPPCRAIEIHPLLVLRTTSHGGGNFSGTMPCDAYEIYQIMAVSPFDGWRQHLCPGGTMGVQLRNQKPDTAACIRFYFIPTPPLPIPHKKGSALDFQKGAAFFYQLPFSLTCHHEREESSDSFRAGGGRILSRLPSSPPYPGGRSRSRGPAPPA